MIDASRIAAQESIINQKKKTSLDKLKNFEELLNNRVGVLSRQQRKSIEYRKKMQECDVKKAATRKNIEQLEIKVE